MERKRWVVLFFGGEKTTEEEEDNSCSSVGTTRASCNRKTTLYGVFFDEREKERKKERKTAVGTFLEHFTGDDRKREREKKGCRKRGG